MTNFARRSFTILAIVAITFMTILSCVHKSVSSAVSMPQGTYKGQFIRSSPLARYAPSNVTIVFSGNTFLGESDKQHYPSICEGTFQIAGTTIEFKNDCIFTADFDWSFVLKDKFEFQMKDGKLEMVKTTGDISDHYSLMLQPAATK